MKRRTTNTWKQRIILSFGFSLLPLSAKTQTVLSAAQVRAASAVMSRAAVVLNQPAGSISRAHQDSVADSVVLVASVSSKGSPSERSLAANATEILGFAGSAGARNPYRGAGQRLLRILDATSDPTVESVAVFSLSQLADSAEAREALRGLIMRNRRASQAVNLLVNWHGEAGLETLRAIYAARPTLEPTARRTLDRLATNHGWAPRPPTS